jgi:hypothetical protein
MNKREYTCGWSEWVRDRFGCSAIQMGCNFHKDGLTRRSTAVSARGEKLLWMISLWLPRRDQGTSISILSFNGGAISAILDCAHQVRPNPTIK